MTEGGRYAIYTRRSLEDSASVSHDMQRAECRRYVAERGGVIALEERDDESGLNPERPGYLRMVAAARRREIDHILVWRFDRFGRALGESASRVDELRKIGVRVVSVTEGDSSILRNISLAIAQDESERTSARVKGAMLHLAGTRGIRPRPPFGYRLVADPESPDPLNPRRMWVIDEAEADLLRRAAARYLAGEPLLAVAAWCRQQVRPEGGPFTSSEGKPVSWHLIRNVFANPALTGRLVWNRESNSRITGRRDLPASEWLAVDDAVPAIFDADTWRRLQAEIASRAVNKGQSRRTKRPLTGLLVCRCGAGMYGFERKATRREYYKCRNEFRENCAPGVVPARPLEWAIAAIILSARVPESDARNAARRREKPATADRRPVLVRAIEKQKERTRAATMGYIDGVLSREAYEEAIADIDRARLALERELAALGEVAPAPDVSEIARLVATMAPSLLPDLTIEHRRQLFRAAIRRATYEGATVTVEWTPGMSAYLGEAGRRVPVPRGRKAAAVPTWIDSRVRRRRRSTARTLRV